MIMKTKIMRNSNHRNFATFVTSIDRILWESSPCLFKIKVNRFNFNHVLQIPMNRKIASRMPAVCWAMNAYCFPLFQQINQLSLCKRGYQGSERLHTLSISQQKEEPGLLKSKAPGLCTARHQGTAESIQGHDHNISFLPTNQQHFRTPRYTISSSKICV